MKLSAARIRYGPLSIKLSVHRKLGILLRLFAPSALSLLQLLGPVCREAVSLSTRRRLIENGAMQQRLFWFLLNTMPTSPTRTL